MAAGFEADGLVISGTGPVRTLTLNRPEHLNAVDPAMHRALTEVWRQIASDEEARVVVLTGEGRGFCAGGDIEMSKVAATGYWKRYGIVEEARRIVTEMITFPLPIVAAVNGPAIGLGASLALFSDIVLMSERAFYADPHVSVGLVAADGGALVWPVLTSMLWAKEYLYTGDRVDAATAVRLGLANRVVAPDVLLTEAVALAERLAGQPRQALQETKRALNIHLDRAVAPVMHFAFAAESESFTMPEFHSTIEQAISRGK